VKKIFLFCFALLLHTFSIAQIPLIYSTDFPDSSRISIGLQAGYELNASALTTKFLTKFYRGGYIDREMKDEVLDRTKMKNRMGANVNMGIFAAFRPDSFLHKTNYSFFFSVQDRQHFNCSYSRDLFKTGFYGNAQFAGTTADFSGFNMTLLRYQQVQVGMFSSQLDSAARWGIGLSFLKGEQYAAVFAEKAELFTSEDGQYIDFNTSIQAASSDTANTGLGAFNGYGASVDLFFEAPFKSRIGYSKLRLSVQDIGLIRFNENSLYLNQDSLFHYTGFNITSVYDLQDSTFTSTSQDSIAGRIIPFKKQAISVTIPATLNLSVETQLSKKFVLTKGLRYIFNGNFNLQVYLRGGYAISKSALVTAHVGYGGYGNLYYGLGTRLRFKSLYIYAGCNDIQGWVTPNRAAGQSAYLSLIKNF
jgi:hypothetical protein